MSSCSPSNSDNRPPSVDPPVTRSVAAASSVQQPNDGNPLARQHAFPPPVPGMDAANATASALVTAQAVIEFAQSFDRNRVKYLIVGGLAVVAHGFTRLTKDVDVVIDFGEGNEGRAISALKHLGYRARIPEPIESFAKAENRVSWASEKDMLVFTVWKQQQGYTNEIDLFLHCPFDFDAAYRNALWKAADEAGDVLLPFVDFDNLIRMKKTAGRPKDLEDIRNLTSLWSPQ